MAELAARIRQAEREVKTLVEGYSDDEEEEHQHAEGVDADIERNRHGLDEGSDDDGESDAESLDALEEKWSELEVSDAFCPRAKGIQSYPLGNRSSTGCRCS